MKKIYFLLFAILVFQNISNAQTYKRVWVSTTEDSTADYFYLNDMVVDINGNTYMSGYEVFPGDQYYQTHLYLVKVNGRGEFQWKRDFDTRRDSIDEAFAVAADTSGNVYVTGRRIDTFCNICTYNTKISDIIIMKYDSEGNRIWLNRYHDSAYILAQPSDITVSSEGAIFITGNEKKYNIELGTYVSKLLILKINKNGETVWIRKKKDIIGNAACFDRQNNIIVAGASNPDNYFTTVKPMILKYDASGNLLWSNIYNEYNKNGQFYYIQCDANNNIYANGQTDTVAFYNHPKIITVKYNSAGLRKWFKRENDFTHTLLHYYGDFKADSAGNCYVTGYFEKNAYDLDWLISKYDSHGEQQWQNLFDGGLHAPDYPTGIAFDKNENTYVGGYVTGSGSNRSFASVIYNKQGVDIASDIYEPAGKHNGLTTGIGLDKNDNVYVGGSMSLKNNPNPFVAVIKYKLKQTASVNTISSFKIINNLKLFPNPTNSILNIAFVTSAPLKNYSLAIHDLNGNTVLSKQLNGEEKIININIDVHELKPGIYTANISNGINAASGSFIKE